jgi:hypothetical protein
MSVGPAFLSSARSATRVAAVPLLAWALALALVSSAHAEGCPNEALRTGYSAYLPDCRAYELVSPPEKGGGEVLEQRGTTGYIQRGSQASSNGNAVAYQSLSAFFGSQGNVIISQYLARRTAGGWSTEDLNTANEASGLNLDWKGEPPYEAFSEDLSTAFIRTFDPPLGGAPAGYLNTYLRDNEDGSYVALTDTAPTNFSPTEENPRPLSFFETATPDWSHVVFSSEGAYFPGIPPGERNLYEWSGGALHLVNVLPDGEVAGDIYAGAGSSGYSDGDGIFNHAISNNGSRIFWTAEGGGKTLPYLDGAERGLFLREDGTRTIEVDASQRTPEEDSGEGVFWGASADGSRVFFTDTLRLTDDSNAGIGKPHEEGDEASDLYEYDVESKKLTDLTAGPGPAKVGAVVGISEDGSYVYFTAHADLAPGATGASSHLYLWHNGETILIPKVELGYNISEASSEPFSVAASNNGLYFALTSDASLTGYDNEQAPSGSCGGACSEVYLYSAASHELTCASCRPNGSRPTGPSWIPADGDHVYRERFLNEDGRLFFDSDDAILPRDTNGVEDVYEYEGGEPSLISNGSGAYSSSFADASADGDDVFFVTRDRLVAGEIDESADLYDARIDGGFEEPAASVPCSGEGCHGASPAAPSFSTPSSMSIASDGNLTPPPALVEKPKPTAAQVKAEKLARALKACKGKRKTKRKACEATARRRYGKKSKTTTKNSTQGSK